MHVYKRNVSYPLQSFVFEFKDECNKSNIGYVGVPLGLQREGHLLQRR